MKKDSERSLKEVLEEWMKQFYMRQGNNEWLIKDAWPRLFGPTIARHTTLLRLSKRTLYVVVDSVPLRQELHIAREKIRTTLNAEIKDNFLEELVIR